MPNGPVSNTNRVSIFDTTLRDGEQSPGCSMTVPEKVRMAHKLAELGVDILEAGFPIASEGDFEAVRAVGAEVDVKVAALARCVAADVERAGRALEKTKQGSPRIHLFLATSEIHLKYKLKKTQDQVVEDACRAVELARKYVGDVEFSAEDGARTEVGYLERVAKAVVAAGASTVNIPDTVGYSLPDEYGALIGRVVKAVPGAIVSVHCHDDLGLAVANSLSAVQNGARQVECTVNGIGERAGNCSLEEVVMAIKTRRDRLPYELGIRTEQLFPASKLLTEIIGVAPQPNKAIVGRNAFAHEAGIHQDGYLKERTTYEIIDPKSVGVPESRLVLGKHSGRHALKARCEELGVSLDREQLDEVYQRFSVLADNKKGLLDEEILALARGVKEISARKIA
ncbi:MAG TPA: 2-isopropylmalate synthase [Polyangia bacterium]|jgi:2-isopropylmalate synthase|nr:2-isopropylmalate synthase [Polyangia bacterium]